MSTSQTERLRAIKTLPSLVAYLRDELDWPIEAGDAEDITFDYDPSELGIDAKSAVRIKEIKQLRPLAGSQPWGIFFVNFEKKRLPVVVMRMILRSLVLKKRAATSAAERQAWQPSDLLFISAYGEDDDRAITFAHFVENPGSHLAELRVLGWDDDDTPLHMDYVARILHDKLTWDAKLTTDPEAWRARWSDAFLIRHRFVITKSDELAAALAVLARRLRGRIRTILRSEDGFGEIRKLQRAFRASLIHDLDDDGFADMFAQTVTYGLFSVSVRRTFPGEGTAVIKDDVPNLIFTSPFLKEMLGTFLGIRSRKGAIDFDELGVSDVTDLLTSPDTHMEVVLADFGKKSQGEDPVIHFYQDFLNSYNKQLRIQRGVFYTPQPVVSYIVRSVHELLQTEFGLEHGLADTTTWGEMIQRNPPLPVGEGRGEGAKALSLPPLTDLPGEKQTISPDEPFVQILDPATGTATFLVEVIDVIHRHLKERWRPADSEKLPGGSPHFKSFDQYWNHYVPTALLPRLHAYELMMAPYAIAHMKLGLKLSETGYKFATEEPARIYLTNALEPWVKQLPLIGFDALAHEAAAVNEIKRHKRFTVVIGNPPYSGLSANMSEDAQRIVDAYKVVDGAALNERKLWLQDDYVKFIRKAQASIDCTDIGVLGYITNHGYLDNPTFRGMRQSLMETFSLLGVLDLHGNAGKKEQSPDGSVDKSVFDIKQGVCICLATRGNNGSAIKHAELWGSRDSKYAWLSTHSFRDTVFSDLNPDSPYYAFVRQDALRQSEYASWLSVWDMFEIYGTGIVTGRDALTTDFEKQTLFDRLKLFASLPEQAARAKFNLGPDARDWKVPTAQRDLREHPPTLDCIVRIQYRPFDSRWTYYTGSPRGLFASPCRTAMKPMLNGKNIGLITARSNASSGNDHFFVTRLISEAKCGESSRQSALFPLYAGTEGGDDNLNFDLGNAAPPNFTAELTRQFSQLLPSAENSTPEAIFHYAYAVFHSPGYRSRYAEFLKIDFPRLPLTANLDLFRALARLGGELTALHLLEAPQLDQPITEFIWGAHAPSRVVSSALAGNIPPSAAQTANTATPPAESSSARARTTAREGACAPLVTRIGWSDNTVWLDAPAKKKDSLQAPGTTGFRGVPEAIWNFHIGGYQVCEKWLKDRKGRTLTADDIAHYHKIVVALSETIRLMAEIDEEIEKAGGWPGAFQAVTASEPVTPPEHFPAKAAPANAAKPRAATRAAWIPGELFGMEGELKPAKKASAAPKAAKKAAKPRPQPAPRQPAPDKNELMALIREIMAKHGPCDRNTLTRHCAQAMGFQRVVQSVVETATNAIRTAKRRGILEEVRGTLHLDRTPLDQWDRTFLKAQFLAALNQNGRIWLKRDDAIRDFARWLGFCRIGPIIDQTARSLINGLVRNRSIEKEGQQWIRRG